MGVIGYNFFESEPRIPLRFTLGFDSYNNFFQALKGRSNLAVTGKYQFQWWACGLANAQPYQGKKKGSDGGTSGLIYFSDEAEGTKKIIVSVKGGENAGSSESHHSGQEEKTG